MTAPSPNGWSRHEELVLHELKRLSEEVSCVDRKLDEVRTKDLPGIRESIAGELGALKVKAGIWGLLGGLIPVVLALGYFVLRAQP